MESGSKGPHGTGEGNRATKFTPDPRSEQASYPSPTKTNSPAHQKGRPDLSWGQVWKDDPDYEGVV